MNTSKIENEAKVIIVVTLIVGLILLASGIIFSIMDYQILSNNKALIGLSFMPLSIALMYIYKLKKIKNTPDEMRKIIINENDERIISLKNEVDSITLKIIKGILFLLYMGYTLMVPEDIFESVGWWILMILMIVTFMLHGILLAISQKKDKAENEVN